MSVRLRCRACFASLVPHLACLANLKKWGLRRTRTSFGSAKFFVNSTQPPVDEARVKGQPSPTRRPAAPCPRPRPRPRPCPFPPAICPLAHTHCVRASFVCVLVVPSLRHTLSLHLVLPLGARRLEETVPRARTSRRRQHARRASSLPHARGIVCSRAPRLSSAHTVHTPHTHKYKKGTSYLFLPLALITTPNHASVQLRARASHLGLAGPRPLS